MSKGSDSRVQDYKAYRDCPLWDKKKVKKIAKKEKKG